MAPHIPADIRILIFRALAVQEAEDGFQQPLMIYSLQANGLPDRVSRMLYEDCVIGYRQADIPIDEDNIAAFNAVRGIEDYIQGVRLIWDPERCTFSDFKLTRRNNLQRIIIDITNGRPGYCECPGRETLYLLKASMRDSPPWLHRRGCTVKNVTVIVDRRTMLYNFFPEHDLDYFSRKLGSPNDVLEIGPTLANFVWNEAAAFFVPGDGSKLSGHFVTKG